MKKTLRIVGRGDKVMDEHSVSGEEEKKMIIESVRRVRRSE